MASSAMKTGKVLSTSVTAGRKILPNPLLIFTRSRNAAFTLNNCAEILAFAQNIATYRSRRQAATISGFRVAVASAVEVNP
jgi:hypothetical protein